MFFDDSIYILLRVELTQCGKVKLVLCQWRIDKYLQNVSLGTSKQAEREYLNIFFSRIDSSRVLH